MMTRRTSLVTLAGLVSGFLVSGSPSVIRSVSAQPTQTEIKERGKQAAKQAQVKWESLTPEQQQKLEERWHADAQKAKEKWDSMTPEQQQQAIAQGKAAAQRVRKKWQQLPE
jgi:acyl-CoA reductase-like NAD-dependent aldehyde dehydrogenase